MFVSQQLLRVLEALGVRCRLRADIPKLKADSRRIARLIESRAQCEIGSQQALFVLDLRKPCCLIISAICHSQSNPIALRSVLLES